MVFLDFLLPGKVSTQPGFDRGKETLHVMTVVGNCRISFKRKSLKCCGELGVKAPNMLGQGAPGMVTLTMLE